MRPCSFLPRHAHNLSAWSAGKWLKLEIAAPVVADHSQTMTGVTPGGTSRTKSLLSLILSILWTAKPQIDGFLDSSRGERHFYFPSFACRCVTGTQGINDYQPIFSG